MADLTSLIRYLRQVLALIASGRWRDHMAKIWKISWNDIVNWFRRRRPSGQPAKMTPILPTVSSSTLAIEFDVVQRESSLNGVGTTVNSPAGLVVSSSLSESVMCDPLPAGLHLFIPSHNARWERPAGPRPSCRTSFTDSYQVPPGPFRDKDKVDASLGLATPPGWQEELTFAHGVPYFINHEKHFVTDTYIRRPAIYNTFSVWENRLHKLIKSHQASSFPAFKWPTKWVAYLTVDEEGNNCAYYIISYEDKQVFWLESIDNVVPLNDNWTGSQIRLYLQTEFWAHMETFPHENCPNADIELREILLDGHLDSEICPGTTSLYSSAQYASFLATLNHFMKRDRSPSSAKNFFVARLTKNFYRVRLHNYFGDEGARVDRAQPYFAIEKAPLWLDCYFFAFLNLLVFASDKAQLNKINDLVLGDVYMPRPWQAFVANFIRETEQSNILATLVFTGNIGFLAISDLTAAQCNACLASTMLSLVSLLLGLHHVRHHTLLLDSWACTAMAYFENARTKRFGYRLLAFFHCLPLALLIWSLMAFSITVSLYAFQTVNALWPSSGMLLVGIAMFLGSLILSTLFFFWNTWELHRPAQRPASFRGSQ